MQDLIARAEKVARRLKDRGETIVVAESSTGGLLSAALLDRKSTRLNSSHLTQSRMPSSA